MRSWITQSQLKDGVQRIWGGAVSDVKDLGGGGRPGREAEGSEGWWLPSYQPSLPHTSEVIMMLPSYQ